MYSNELICNILDYLNSNIYNQVSIDDISAIFGYEKSYIMKKFKKELNITIINYINSKRIINSLESFKSDDYILKIALDNGFNSLEYFSEMFSKIMGVSPSIYRNYTDRNGFISLEDEFTIQNNLSYYLDLFNSIDMYKLRRKPIYTPVMKLSITQKKNSY